jgi:3-hydroxyacyl-CoA dehydrogenase
VAKIIKDVAREYGIKQRSFSDQEILHRILFASVNEACKILSEGIARSASDIDAAWLNGYGFPRHRGGLLFWADTLGASAIYAQVAAWAEELGARWEPAPLLREYADMGRRFTGPAADIPERKAS